MNIFLYLFSLSFFVWRQWKIWPAKPPPQRLWSCTVTFWNMFAGGWNHQKKENCWLWESGIDRRYRHEQRGEPEHWHRRRRRRRRSEGEVEGAFRRVRASVGQTAGKCHLFFAAVLYIPSCCRVFLMIILFAGLLLLCFVNRRNPIAWLSCFDITSNRWSNLETSFFFMLLYVHKSSIRLIWDGCLEPSFLYFF